MTIDAKYKKILTDQTVYLSQMQRACEDKCAEIDREASQWRKDSEEAEKELKNYLYSVRPGKLHKKIKRLVLDRKSSATKIEQSGNFDKFAYYIDMINAEKTPKYIVRNNPNYCDTVLAVAVDEYHKLSGDIRRMRADQKDVIKIQKDAFLSNSKKQVLEKMNEFYRRLDALAEEETNSIIREFSK